jgi:hypothetical protein
VDFARHLALFIITVSVIPSCYAQEARPARILATGEVDPSYCPISGFGTAEPSLDVTLAVAREMHGTTFGERGLKKLIRLYIPRNLEKMLEYDFILLNQPVIKYFPTSSLRQMYTAIAEHGLGGLCFMESQYYEIYGPWLETQLSECFPYDHYANIKIGAPGDKNYELEIVRDPNIPPLLMPYIPLGIEKIKPYGQARPTFEREGATVWAYCKTNDYLHHGFDKYPLFISWEYGPSRAVVWATADQFDSPMWITKDDRERFALDIFAGIVWLGSGWDLPDDPIRVHLLRDSFVGIKARIRMIHSLVEFIDRFGANTRKIELELGNLEALTKEAGRLYLEHDFESSELRVNDAYQMAAEIEDRAITLKENALTWVYLVEWLVVSSCCILTGWTLWTLMIRRRLYREVGVTASGPR